MVCCCSVSDGRYDHFFYLSRICNPEGYKLKTVVRSTVRKWTQLMKNGKEFWPFGYTNLCKVFTRLLRIFQYVLWQDSLLSLEQSQHPWLTLVKKLNVVEEVQATRILEDNGKLLPKCDFCHADIWNRFVQCSEYHRKDPYVVCLGCYGEGRGCCHRALNTMVFYQMFTLESVEEEYEEAAKTLNAFAQSTSVVNYIEISEDWKVGYVTTGRPKLKLVAAVIVTNASFPDYRCVRMNNSQQCRLLPSGWHF